MNKYSVRSGQNIYDVALTLYGSVEGIFDLLISNPELSMETELRYGMNLNYHEDFIINKDLAIWLKENKILVKNGEHVYNFLDIKEFIQEHFSHQHPDVFNELTNLSNDEQSMFWESISTPRMIIKQQGQLSVIKLQLKPSTHLIVDWGDYSAPEIIMDPNTSVEFELEHCFKGSGSHIITIYGDCEFEKLDLRELNGVYYPLGIIYVDEFSTSLIDEELRKLIIPK